jgi:RNA polymerase primary sigma factor
MIGKHPSRQLTAKQSLDKYLDEISQIPLLSAAEEIELAKRVGEGDHGALERLVKGNLRFVVKVAKEYQGQGLPLMDLINEGNIGLIKAAKRFDVTRGFRFISYAVWWIRQSILQSLAEQARIVRLPLNRVGLINKVNQITRELEQEYNREPSSDEISNILKVPDSEVGEAISHAMFHLSLDQPLQCSEEGNIKEFLQNPNSIMPDKNLIIESLKEEISRVLKTLKPKEETILKLYFGLDCHRPLTLEEIGDKLHLTRERVRQIKERALTRLRHQSRSQDLKFYL